MVQKYQNEIAPIFYYGISTKTNEKDLKIPNLQLPAWNHPSWMSLYVFHKSFCIEVKDNIGCRSAENFFWRGFDKLDFIIIPRWKRK